MFWPFNLGLTAQLTTYAGLILALTAGADWLRNDAKNDVRMEIREEFREANDQLKLEVAEKQKKLDLLQKVLAATEIEAAKLSKENTEKLEKQREAIPLSEACNACRVPNEQLWLRGTERKQTPATRTKGGGSS